MLTTLSRLILPLDGARPAYLLKKDPSTEPTVNCFPLPPPPASQPASQEIGHQRARRRQRSLQAALSSLRPNRPLERCQLFLSTPPTSPSSARYSTQHSNSPVDTLASKAHRAPPLSRGPKLLFATHLARQSSFRHRAYSPRPSRPTQSSHQLPVSSCFTRTSLQSE
jgi:hypothetical protein